MESKTGRKLYVGGLNTRCDADSLKELMSRYGRVEDVWVARCPPGFAFVVMEDSRDAEDCIKELDGEMFMQYPIKVELAKPDPPRNRFAHLQDRNESRKRDTEERHRGQGSGYDGAYRRGDGGGGGGYYAGHQEVYHRHSDAGSGRGDYYHGGNGRDDHRRSDSPASWKKQSSDNNRRSDEKSSSYRRDHSRSSENSKRRRDSRCESLDDR
eukprot:GHVH01011844.1.p1 GENE.GHVH01011844.1~~GHVH01011844.1.p1  ORF type:complete len:211 (+),score=35.24 GHVH01011844.1:97-729(+)